MNETKHAPGPWTWCDVSGAGLQISATLPAGFNFSGIGREADGKTSFMIWTVREAYTVQIADERWVQFSTGSWEEMQKANAALMAAAPDLLAALKWAEAALSPFSKEPAEKSGINMIRAAIAKAEGAVMPNKRAGG